MNEKFDVHYHAKSPRVEWRASDGTTFEYDRLGVNFNYTIRPKSPCGYNHCDHPVKFQLMPRMRSGLGSIKHANDCGCHAESAKVDVERMQRGDAPLYYKWYRWST